MKKMIRFYLLLIGFASFSQEKKTIIYDIFSTQTHDWIDCEVTLPFDYNMKKVVFRNKHNRREKYIYRFYPLSKKINKYIPEMNIANFIISDSSAINDLALFYNGRIIKIGDLVGIVNDEYLIAHKSFKFEKITYFFTISIKHNQGIKALNIDDFTWFIEFMNKIEFSHLPNH